jgi:hypothetical protein
MALPSSPTPTSSRPRRGGWRGGYVMRATFEPLPSPLMGEGSGGGEDRPSSPPPPPSPAKGEGVTYPCQRRGRGE